jgi:hypothetical protein
MKWELYPPDRAFGCGGYPLLFTVQIRITQIWVPFSRRCVAKL